MEYLFKDIVKNLEYNELQHIMKDLEKGAFQTKKIIKEHMKEKEKDHERYCSVCSSSIDYNNPQTYTILFGPEGFKKKATFCALDCMKYFLSRLEEMNQKVEQK